MVNSNLIDNQHALSYDETVTLFKKLIHDSFGNHILLKIKKYGMAFKIECFLNEYEFIFRSEKGYIEEYLLLNDGENLNLQEYEPFLKNIEVTSQKNINFLILTLKIFIEKFD